METGLSLFCCFFDKVAFIIPESFSVYPQDYSMAGTSPLMVDVGVDVTPMKPVKEVVAEPLHEDKARAGLQPNSKEIVLFKVKKGKGQETWNPQDFHKDAEFFRLVCGLPCDGLAPHKIPDISEDELSKVFGESSKNGYKLSNVQGIPHEHILALSQVVDGYDKPVNGILSHTFVKGVYADLKQNRKVNWAAYAATKLKGQVTQWARDGKPKPEGPPCIRKPQRYVKPTAPMPKAALIRVMGQPEQKPVESAMQEFEDLSALLTIPKLPANPLPFQMHYTLAESSETPTSKNVLISIMESEMSKMQARLVDLKDKARSVESSVDRLKRYEVDYQSMEATCRDEMMRLRDEERNLVAKMKVEDDRIEELTTDIELESNKLESLSEDDGGGDVTNEVTEELLKYMTTSLETHTATAKSLDVQLETTREILSAATDDLAQKVKKRPDTALTFSRLSKVSAALMAEQAKIESNLKAQEVEFKIISDVYSARCPPVIMPCYTITSTTAVCFEVDVSTCPICCNGYHCFNWVPASCGHTFHPACLFASISSCNGAPKCFACGEAFSGDWLQTWGIERFRVSEIGVDGSLPRHQDMILKMADTYGTNCGLLAQRRQCVKTLDKDFHSKAKHCLETIVLSSTVVTCSNDEGGESLLVPKVEDESKDKRKSSDHVQTAAKKQRRGRNTLF